MTQTAYPVALTDPMQEPDLLACTCGQRWPWVWHTPRTSSGRVWPPRWAAPKVNPCPDCRPDPNIAAELEIRERLRAADLPEPMWRYRFDRVTVQRPNEDYAAFQARAKAERQIGASTENLGALRKVKDWAPPEWLVLHGPPGTGKTTVMAAIARRLLTSTPDEQVDLPARSYPTELAEEFARSRNLHKALSRIPIPQVEYHRVDELVRRETVRMRGLDPHPTVDVAKVQILMLDELGLTERPTEAEARLIERVLCYRHDRGLCTIVATNRSWEELTTGKRPLYGWRVADRLRTAVDVALGGPSWRAA